MKELFSIKTHVLAQPNVLVGMNKYPIIFTVFLCVVLVNTLHSQCEISYLRKIFIGPENVLGPNTNIAIDQCTKYLMMTESALLEQNDLKKELATKHLKDLRKKKKTPEIQLIQWRVKELETLMELSSKYYKFWEKILSPKDLLYVKMLDHLRSKECFEIKFDSISVASEELMFIPESTFEYVEFIDADKTQTKAKIVKQGYLNVKVPAKNVFYLKTSNGVIARERCPEGYDFDKKTSKCHRSNEVSSFKVVRSSDLMTIDLKKADLIECR